jgi:hypothetical protein
MPGSSSGTPMLRQYSSQSGKPSGGGSSSYPSAAAQNRASRSGSVQSITSWNLTPTSLSFPFLLHGRTPAHQHAGQRSGEPDPRIQVAA